MTAQRLRTALTGELLRSYQNFPDPDLPSPTDGYHTSNAARVRRVRQRYDPQRRFHFEAARSG